MQVLRDRQSKRSFSDKKLPPQVLSNLLWAAWGVNRPGTGLRTAPSAHNAQEIDMYVAMEEGLFLYEAPLHQLRRILAEDVRRQTAISVMWDAYVSPAPVNLVYVADLTKMNQNLCFADTGYITQNVYLYCASEGLCTVVRGTLPQELRQTLGLNEDQMITVAQTVGYDMFEHVFYFPSVMTESDWETEIALVNTSRIHSLRGVLKAYDYRGQELSSITIAGTGMSIDLDPRERREITIEKSFITPEHIRYLMFMTDSEQCTGYATYSIAGRCRSSVPAVHLHHDSDMPLPRICSEQDRWTRLCLLNTSYDAQPLSLTFDNGAQKDITLGPNGQYAPTISDLFAGQRQETITSGMIRDLKTLSALCFTAAATSWAPLRCTTPRPASSSTPMWC